MSNAPARQPKSRTGRRRAAANLAPAERRAAGYGRLSLRTDETTSPERQTGGVDRYIAAMGWLYDPAVDFYGDFDSISGSKDITRPAFEALMANLDRYDVIVVWKLDRFTRRLKELVAVMEMLHQRNIALVAIEDSIDTSKGQTAALLASIIGAVAQMEAENTGERVASAQDYLTRNGRYRGGQVPFGFREASSKAEGGHYYRQEPAEVEMIVWAIGIIVADGSMSSIARTWNEAGVEPPRVRTMREGWERRAAQAAEAGEEFTEPAPDPKGKAWTPVTVRYLLSNPILKGHGTFGEDVVRDEAGLPLEIAPPIIDAAAFDYLVAKVEGRGRGGRGIVRKAHTSMLGNIATCGECGRPLQSNGKHYGCKSYTGHQGVEIDNPCTGVAIEKDRLDSYVLGWLATQLSNKKLQATARALAAAEPEVIEDPHEERRAAITATLRRMREDRNAGLYDGAEDNATYQRDTLALKAELAEKAAPVVVHDELRTLLAEPVTFEEMMAKDVPELRRFLAAVLGELVVAKGHRGHRRPVKERVRIALVGALVAPAPTA